MNLAEGVRALLLTVASAVQIGAMVEEVENMVAIVPYPLTDDLQTGVVLEAVQVHVRGTKTGGVRPVLNLRDQILDLLAFGTMAMPRGRDIGGVHVSACWRQIAPPIAPDSRGRPEIRDTYYLRTDRLGYAG